MSIPTDKSTLHSLKVEEKKNQISHLEMHGQAQTISAKTALKKESQTTHRSIGLLFNLGDSLLHSKSSLIHLILLCIMYTHVFVCIIQGIITSMYIIIIPMYNTHRNFSLKNLGKKCALYMAKYGILFYTSTPSIPSA